MSPFVQLVPLSGGPSWYLRFRSGFEKSAFTILALALCLSQFWWHLCQSHLHRLQKFSCLDVPFCSQLSWSDCPSCIWPIHFSNCIGRDQLPSWINRCHLHIFQACFTDLGSGWDLRDPPLPSSVTIMATHIVEQDAMTWASDNSSEGSLPLSSANSPHCSDDFAATCTFFTTFTPSFHHTECPSEDGIPPILDTGAAHDTTFYLWDGWRVSKLHKAKRSIFKSLVAAKFAGYLTTSFTGNCH